MKPILSILVCLSFCCQVAGAVPQNAPQQISLQRTPSTGSLVLTLQDAVRLALENNPALKVEKIRIEQARSRIENQKGDFNPLFNSSSSFFRRDNIVASRFYPTGVYNETQGSQTLGIEKKTRTGGRVNFGLLYSDLRSSSNTQTLSPQYSANFSIGFTHSLLRDFGRTVTETRIRIAEKGSIVAQNNLFTRIAQMIQRVEEAYWSLSFLLKNLEEKQRSLENAREFLAQNENLFRAGRVAQVSVLQARAAVAERDRDVITAQATADEYEDRLKNLLWLDLNTADVTPADSPEQGPVVADVQRSLEAALQRRPEIQALQREIEQRELEVKYAENQRRPRLDFTAQYISQGLSGKPNPTCLDPTTELCIPVGLNVAGSILANKTGRRDAVNSVFSNHPFENWTVELKFQLPIGNGAAKAQYDEATLRQLESQATLIGLRDQIAIEIRDSIRNAQAAQKRIEASREALTFVQDQLEGMRRQLDAGLVSSYDILKAFDELDRARTTELQAVMDLNVAITKLRLAEASGFQRYNVELADAPRYTFDRTGIIK